MNTYPFTSKLGWSFSRYSIFTDCKMKYYYNYYGKYDENSQKIQELKSMTSYPIELGNVVHKLIRDCIKDLKETGKLMNLNSLTNLLSNYKKNAMSATYIEIQNNIYNNLDFDRFENDVKTAIKNFYGSDRLNYLVNNLNNKHKWQIEGSGYGETRIEGMKAYCKTDFVFFDNHNKCVIIDWKTGKKNGRDKNQLYGYANWVKQELRIPLSEIQTITAYLMPDYSESEPVTYNDTEYENFVEQVKKETQEMKDYLINFENNTPKSKEDFEKSFDGKKCKNCNFYTLCK